MHQFHPDGSETFALSTGMKFLFRASVVVGLVLILIFAVSAYSMAMAGNRSGFWLAIGLMVLIAVLVILSAPEIRRLDNQIRVTRLAITQERAGSEPISLAWNEIASMRERPFHHRLELHGVDGFTVLGLEYQFTDFDTLRRIVAERVNWTNIDDHAEVALRYPLTLYKSTAFFVVHGLFIVCASTFAVFTCTRGVWAGLIGLPLAFLWLVDNYKIRVDHDALTLFYPFRTRIIRAADIAEVTMTTIIHKQYGMDTAHLPMVEVRLKTGKALTLSGMKGGAVSLFQALRILKPSAAPPRTRP